MKWIIAVLLSILPALSQIVQPSQGGTGTRPAVALPTTCTVGKIFFKTDAAAGSNLYGCTAANTWTLEGGSGTGLAYCADATGSTTAYTCPSATYSLTAGARATFVPQATNTTTTPTVAIAGGAAKTIKNSDGTAVVAGQLVGSKPYDLEYNGTDQLILGEHLAAGASGAMILDRTVNPPTLDIVTSVVPQKAAANTWTGANDFSGAATTKPMKAGTTPPATCAVGEYFNDTDATAGSNTFACTAVNTWTVQGSGSFDPTDVTQIFINEEWLTGNTTLTGVAGLGQNAWQMTFSVSAPTASYAAGVANHFGILSLLTSASGSEVTHMVSPAAGDVIGMDTVANWTLVSVLKTDANTTNLTALWSGLGTGFTTSIIIIYEPATSANWLLRTCKAGTCTDTSTGVAYANSTWFTFTIDCTVAGTIGGKVTGGSRVTSTTNIPSAVMPFSALSALTNGTAHTFLSDKFAFKITGITR